jgi:hypothetical protein
MLFDPNWKPPLKTQEQQKISQILKDAADLIERNGWCRSYSHAGRHCAVGAINRVMDLPVDLNSIDDCHFFFAYNPSLLFRKKVLLSLEKFIGDSTDYSESSIERWNDECKKGNKVIKIMREAANAV